MNNSISKDEQQEESNESMVKTVSGLLHDLSQSLLVIHAYVSGCNERMKNNGLSAGEFSEALKKIDSHTEIMGHKIHTMNQQLSAL
jgi:hypothetical protein